MTILSRIRNRVGLLVGIIFLALLSFVLTDLFSAQNIFGGQQSSDLGEINGNTITLKEFQRRVDKIEIDQKRTLSEEEQQQLSESFWMEKIDEHVYEPEWKKVGISLTDNELAEQMYGDRPSPHMNAYFQDPQTGQIAQQFAGPDGSLSGEKIRDFVKKMEPKVEEQWAQIEDALRKTLIKEKYNTLLRKGFYVTSAQAKREYADENTKYNFKYIVKKFTEIPDSTVKVTDEEMKEYYVSHQWKFKQANATRSMEYVAFDIYPSAQDIADQ
ncbi:MAG TPA: SurA N-terminal domain-containing protein, partial [Bacteroidia bacterium]|nr:SurA N-terminal domain-containing protein [Bacteroidia bacterium]